VLTAMGLDYADAKASLRMSISTESLEEEINLAIAEISDLVRRQTLVSAPAKVSWDS
jgi:cysteine sulfinate desulfinase/cysteine desulfurase-like protein